MHAETIVARLSEQALAWIHGARRRVFAAVAWAVMCGSAVRLSRLARGMSARAARRSARESWVLAYSIGLRGERAEAIVVACARRVQTAENLHHTKSLAFGMSVVIVRSRSALRLQPLPLIATLAAWLLWQLGKLAEAEGMPKRLDPATRALRVGRTASGAGADTRSEAPEEDCREHAVAASFFVTLKVEAPSDAPSANRQQTRAPVFNDIGAYYNRDRVCPSIGVMAPQAFELPAVA